MFSIQSTEQIWKRPTLFTEIFGQCSFLELEITDVWKSSQLSEELIDAYYENSGA